MQTQIKDLVIGDTFLIAPRYYLVIDERYNEAETVTSSGERITFDKISSVERLTQLEFLLFERGSLNVNEEALMLWRKLYYEF